MKTSGMSILKWAVFIAASLIAMFTILIIPRLHKEIPDVPEDVLHMEVTRIEACIECHGAGGGKPLAPSHKAQVQCLYCHSIKKPA